MRTHKNELSVTDEPVGAQGRGCRDERDGEPVGVVGAGVMSARVFESVTVIVADTATELAEAETALVERVERVGASIECVPTAKWVRAYRITHQTLSASRGKVES